MHQSQIPEKPLVASMDGGKVEQAQKIYFFEREDGTILQAQAREAWNLWNNRNQVVGRGRTRFKLIGTSDGQSFRQGIIESKSIFREKGLEAAQARIRQGLNEELEKARGHIEPPPNMDRHGPGSNYLQV